MTRRGACVGLGATDCSAETIVNDSRLTVSAPIENGFQWRRDSSSPVSDQRLHNAYKASRIIHGLCAR
jgi:hypothetical protein